MPVSNLHKNAQRIIYPSFDGGLNLSVPPSMLQPNELQEAKNVEFDSSVGAMKTRGALAWIGDINTIYGYPDRHATSVTYIKPGIFIFRDRNFSYATRVKITSSGMMDIKAIKYSDESAIVQFTGSGALSTALWEAKGNNISEYLIASGGKLQRFIEGYDGEWHGVTIQNSPSYCHKVFTRSGRAGVVNGGSTLTFSAVGDCTSWTNNPSDASSAQFLDIGYKDGMDID